MKRWMKYALSLILALALCFGSLASLAETWLELPEGLTTIGQEAFRGVAATAVAIPDQVESIGANAFIDSGIQLVSFPEELPEISENAIDWESVTLAAPRGSAAETALRAQGLETIYAGYEFDAPDVQGYDELSGDDEEEPQGPWIATVYTSLSADTLILSSRKVGNRPETEVRRWRLSDTDVTVADQRYRRAWSVSYEPEAGAGSLYVLHAQNSCAGYGEPLMGEGLKLSINAPDGLITSFSCSGSDDEEIKPLYEGEKITLDYSLSGNAAQMRLVTVGGETLKTWDGPFEESGSLTYAFTAAGEYEVTLCATQDGENWYTWPDETLAFTVYSGAGVWGIDGDSEVYLGDSAYCSVSHTRNTKKLRLYKGITPLGTWDAEEPYEEWDADLEEYILIPATSSYIDYTFTRAGTYNLTVKASADGKNWDDGMPWQVKVLSSSAPRVIDYEGGDGLPVKGVASWLSFATTANAAYAALYNANGQKLKSWKASSSNSEVEDNWRYWHVSYAFPTAGIQNYTLKASKDNKTFGGALGFAVMVTDKPVIYNYDADGMFEYDDENDQSVLLSMTTSSAVKKVRLFNAQGGMICDMSPGDEENENMASWVARLSPDLGQWYTLDARLSLNGSTFVTSDTLVIHAAYNPALDFSSGRVSGLSGIFTADVSSLDLAQRVQAVRMLDMEGAVLHQWARSDMEIADETEEGDPGETISLTVLHTFDEAGKYRVKFQYTENGADWIDAGIDEVSVSATELTAYSRLDELEAIAGGFKTVHTDIYLTIDEEAGYIVKHDFPGFTTVKKPGRFYVLEFAATMDDGELCRYKLCDGGCGFTVCGIKPGMTRAEARAAAIAFGLQYCFLNSGNGPAANQDTFTLMAKDDMIAAVDYDGSGIVTQVYYGKMDGE